MQRILQIELRRSLVVLTSPAFAGLLALLMLHKQEAWRGSWPEASAAVTSALVFITPLLAGLSAWEVKRRCLAANDTESPPWLVPLFLVHIASAVTVITAGAVCAVWVNLMFHAPAGFLWPSYLLVGLAGLIECLAVGFLLGRLPGPAWFPPAIAMMLTFLRITMTSGGLIGAPRSRFTRVFLTGRSWVGLSPTGVLLALLAAAVAVLAALYLPDLLKRVTALRARTLHACSPGTRLASIISIGVTVLALGAVTTGPPLTYERAAPAQPLCTSTAMRLCVWPEDAARLPALTRLAQRA